MAISREYELSIWEDRKVALGRSGAEYVTESAAIAANDPIINTYYKEQKIATIASSAMANTPVRAYNVILSQKVNGANGVTFSIARKYWNVLLGRMEENPFLPYLINERKVKLYFKNKWYELYIQNVVEDSKTDTFTYECQDSYVNELAKTGTKIVLNTTLYNNMGTVNELAQTTLIDTDWRVAPTTASGTDPVSDRLNQYKTEILYQVFPSNDISGYEINMENGTIASTSTTLTAADHNFYVFYSDFVGTSERLQFIALPSSEEIEKDSRGIIINADAINYEAPRTAFATTSQNEILQKTTFGNRIVRHNRGKYIPQVETYCNEYYKVNNGVVDRSTIYYGYPRTLYASADDVKSLINNSSGFNSTKGWTYDLGTPDTNPNDNRPTIFIDTYESTRNRYLNISGTCYNDGLFINRSSTKTYTKGERICLLWRSPDYGWAQGSDYPRLDTIELQVATDVNTYSSFCTLYEYTGTQFRSGGSNFTEQDEADAQEIYQLFNVASGPTYTQVYFGIVTQSISQAQLGVDEYATTRIAFNVHPNATQWTGANYHAWATDIQLFKITPTYHLYDGGEIRHLLLPATAIPMAQFPTYTPVLGETHFRTGLIYYELINNVYTQTNDATFDPTKTYYVEITDPTYSNSYYKTQYFFFNSDLTNVPTSSYVVYDSVLDARDVEANFTLRDDDAYPYEKISSIEEADSNCFNILQSLCEKFECWAQFYIGHDAIGNIEYKFIPHGFTSIDQFNPYIVYYNSTFIPVWWPGQTVPTSLSSISTWLISVPKKWVVFKKYIGRDNDVGFRYGINLDGIKRTINSDQIVTKLIVQSNSNEFAKNKSCTLQAAALNPTKENTILTFDYYTQKKILDAAEVNEDLYGSKGYITQLAAINAPLNQLVDETSEMSITIRNLQSTLAAYDTVNATVSYEPAPSTYDSTEDYYQKITADGTDDNYEPVLITASMKQDWGSYYDKLFVRRLTATGNIATLAPSYSRLFFQHTQALLTYYRTEYQLRLQQLDELRQRKAQLNRQFFTKYAKFLKEGGWTSEDYYDPDLYYDAALQVAYRSAMPQVTYDISVAAIEVLPGREMYEFQIGDKTYVEDTEFFGYDSDGRPYKEEIIVSECAYVLDDPIQDKIVVKNYKTQFEELFQRIAASTNTVQFNEGKYDRSVSTSIDNTEVLNQTQQTLENNGITFDTNLMEMRFRDKALIDLSLKQGQYAAGLQALIYPNGAEASIFASIQGPDGNINAASITTAINNSDSSVTIQADKINLITGQLLVKNSQNQILLQAGNQAVSIGGWTVKNDGFYNSSNNLYIGPTETKIGWYNSNNGFSGFQVGNGSALIGGWNIGVNTLYNVNGTNEAGLHNGSIYYSPSLITSGNSRIMMYAGAPLNATSQQIQSAPFRVLADGSLYCSQISIKNGNLSARYNDEFFSSGLRVDENYGLYFALQSKDTTSNRTLASTFTTHSYAQQDHSPYFSINSRVGTNGDAIANLLIEYDTTTGKYLTKIRDLWIWKPTSGTSGTYVDFWSVVNSI